MRRTLAAGLLACALAAHAQPSPGPAPPAEPQPAAAPAQQPSSTPNPPAAAAPPATESTGIAEPAAPPTPPPRTPKSAPRAAPPPPAEAESAHEAELSTLRAEVNRLQSELDAARAAALPPPEETPAVPPARNPWGWLLATALLALAAGFVLGWRLLDRRIRRRFGGLRIY